MTDKMREAFEKWATGEGLCVAPYGASYLSEKTHAAWITWQAAKSVPVVERPDCGTCANRGRVDGLSQETFCEHCSWSEKWRKNNYKPIAMQERQP